MKNMTVKEVSVIAKGLNITLSYKGESGTRKRYTKSELIEMITKVQSDNEKVVFVSTEMDIPADLKSNIAKLVKFENAFGYSNTGKSKLIEETKANIELQLNTVVSESRKLISHGKIEKVKLFIDELTSRIKNERRNKLLIANMSSKLNILKSLIKQYSNKSTLSF